MCWLETCHTAAISASYGNALSLHVKPVLLILAVNMFSCVDNFFVSSEGCFLRRNVATGSVRVRISAKISATFSTVPFYFGVPFPSLCLSCKSNVIKSLALYNFCN